jgi:hypothetical protein
MLKLHVFSKTGVYDAIHKLMVATTFKDIQNS